MKEVSLFHGTPARNAKCIEDEGFLGSELTTFTANGCGSGEVIFVTTDIDEARQYGEAVYEIRNVKLHRLAGAQTTTEGYVTLDDLTGNGNWERIE